METKTEELESKIEELESKTQEISHLQANLQQLTKEKEEIQKLLASSMLKLQGSNVDLQTSPSSPPLKNNLKDTSTICKNRVNRRF